MSNKSAKQKIGSRKHKSVNDMANPANNNKARQSMTQPAKSHLNMSTQALVGQRRARSVHLASCPIASKASRRDDVVASCFSRSSDGFRCGSCARQSSSARLSVKGVYVPLWQQAVRIFNSRHLQLFQQQLPRALINLISLH